MGESGLKHEHSKLELNWILDWTELENDFDKARNQDWDQSRR